MDEKREIGWRVQRLRYERGYTREALAEKTGLSARFLAAVEAGRKGTSSSTIIKLSAALHTTADFLLFGDRGQRENVELPFRGVPKEKQKELEGIFLKVSELFAEP